MKRSLVAAAFQCQSKQFPKWASGGRNQRAFPSASITVSFRQKPRSIFPLQRLFSSTNEGTTVVVDNEKAKTTISPSALQQQQPQPRRGEKHLESFKVAQINYKTGIIQSVYLPPEEILRQTSILPRDLVALQLTTRRERRGKRLPRHFTRPPSAILPRTDSILLSFGNIRAVATRESVFILEANNPIAKSFAEDVAALFPVQQNKHPHLAHGIRTTTTTAEPPELIFLEGVLRDTVETFTRRIRLMEPIVEDFVDRASEQVFSEQGVAHLAPLKDALQNFELTVKQSVDCLTELLNDDDEMLNLLLTEQAHAKSTGTEVEFDRHQHVDLLLSVYARQLTNVLQEIHYLLGRLQSKQEFVALALAGYRNRLVRMNVNIGIVGVSTGIMTAATGLFGMNLISGLEESASAFLMVTGVSTCFAVGVAGVYFQLMDGKHMQRQAEERIKEVETLTHALSDMGAVDYTVKKMLRGDTVMLTRDEFKRRMVKARQSNHITEEEVDFLFQVFDRHKDNYISKEDFERMEKIWKSGTSVP